MELDIISYQILPQSGDGSLENPFRSPLPETQPQNNVVFQGNLVFCKTRVPSKDFSLEGLICFGEEFDPDPLLGTDYDRVRSWFETNGFSALLPYFDAAQIDDRGKLMYFFLQQFPNLSEAVLKEGYKI